MDCKQCKHSGIKFADTERGIAYGIECNRHGLIADHFNELPDMVQFETGKPCGCFRK